jgi:signal transduction histidine kinase
VARAKEREATMLRAFDALGESASALVHEIKNPITAVNAALCAVASRLGEDHQTVLRELVERMQKLERMLRRALAFAGPLDLHLETCEVAALARSVAESFRERGEARGASLEVDAPLPLVVSVDPTRIAEVVRELLANAAEAAGSGGRVRISARPGRCETVRVDVDDDGLGLPDVPTEELFRPFFTTRPNATGLGLSISRVIARAHGAELRASSGDLGGARFRLELPSTVR